MCCVGSSDGLLVVLVLHWYMLCPIISCGGVLLEILVVLVDGNGVVFRTWCYVGSPILILRW